MLGTSRIPMGIVSIRASAIVLVRLRLTREPDPAAPEIPPGTT